MEIAIKLKIRKLFSEDTTIDKFVIHILENDFVLLPIIEQHIATYLEVPLFEKHRDPFDRFIIATAKFENMAIMTNDSKFTQYQIFVQLWK